MLVRFHTTPRGGGVPSGVDQLRPLGEPVGVGAGFDDGAAEGVSVDDGGAEPRVGEGLGPAGEGLVGRDRDGRFLLALGQDLKEQLGTAAVRCMYPSSSMHSRTTRP